MRLKQQHKLFLERKLASNTMWISQNQGQMPFSKEKEIEPLHSSVMVTSHDQERLEHIGIECFTTNKINQICFTVACSVWPQRVPVAISRIMEHGHDEDWHYEHEQYDGGKRMKHNRSTFGMSLGIRIPCRWRHP